MRRLPRAHWITTYTADVAGMDDPGAAPPRRMRPEPGRSRPVRQHARHEPVASRQVQSARARAHVRREAGRPPAAALPHTIGEALFRDVLGRECKRAERFDECFTLVLIRGGISSDARRPGSGRTKPDPHDWSRIIDSVCRAVGDDAIVGWFEEGVTLGAVVLTPDADSVDASVKAGLERAHAATATRISVQCCGPHGFLDSADPAALLVPARAEPAGVYTAGKRAVDIVGSLVLLMLAWPLLVLAALAVKLTSPGPMLFRQTRVGHRAQPFTMIKFRTMRADTDQSMHQQFVSGFIKQRASVPAGGEPVLFKLRNDPRVTALGRVLRKTSIDELPQLWNVLRGEMSLVGPRPPLRSEVAQYEAWHRRRVLDAKPGLTGLWQVTGRSTTTFPEMVRLDLAYARTRSFATDFRILLKTPRAVLSGKGAL